MLTTEPIHLLVIGQVLGLFFVIMTAIMIARASHYRKLMQNLDPDSGLIAVSASISLIFGLILVVTHNIWLMDSDLLLTVVGWAVVIKAILWLALPERMTKVCQVVYAGNLYYVMALLIGVVGVLMLSHGYYLFMPRSLVMF
ncbi:hypothetical protein [Legionella sp. CNM-4043-24]|uniref:hypothetical protein n=1 Tax=Legionella sp. CNM-4043-24 TaxID=3421646 RepID=UPI00403ABCC7